MYEYEGVDRMTYNNVAGLNERWTQLRAEANFRDFSMLKVKEHFSTVTTNDVAQFYSGVKIAYEQYMTDGPGAEGTSLKDGDILLLNYKEKIAELNKKREELVHAQQLFNLPITAYPELVEIEDQNRKLTVIYDLYRDQQASINEWSGMTWVNIDINSIEKGSDEFYKRLNRMNSEYHVLTAYHKLKEFVAGFKESVPLIKMMKSDAIKDRHWKKLMKETGLNIDIDLKTITLQQIFDLQLQNHQEKVEEIINEASQESKIEESLQNVEQFWKTCNFEIGDYKKGNEFKSYALKSADEITGRIENDLADLGQIGNSRFAGAFMGKVSGWEKQLNTVQDTIDIWFIVQTRWQYLESIFIGSDDIRLQLVEEAKKFDRINKKFIKIMENTSKNPNVMACCYQEASRAEEKLNELTDIYNDLESCQKRLTSYLNTKKGAFPRFYFISDDELLSILGSTDAMAVQPHMLKLYDNCKELKFGRGNMVTGMWSDEGEDFEFLQGVKTEGAVEDWMNRVDDAMIETLRHIMKHAVFNYAKEERIIWCQEQLGMVTLAGTAIWWTWYIEDVFRKVLGGNKHAMKDESAKETKQLQDVIGVIRDTDNSIIRKKINALIIMDVHARDIVDKFVRDSVLDARQFEWESQLRFAWNRDVDDIRVNQCTGEFPYCYEYQGLNGRLVITPLTDRCIMTLTTALTFHLGGAPAGPAGTGKTETVKDLAKSLAIRCVVNNCGEGLDAFAMGTIFSGLAQTGFWGCFDEFNRILPEVLSVVASQIRTVQYALNNGRATLDLLGKDIPIKTTVGIFVTMNPGYAGRTELPDNLKALFRPVVMCVPDMDMICEIMLMSEGFIQARVLAKKMTVLYDLAKGQLSKQHHYDFGLRALKSVLVMAGSLKRGSPDLTEDIVLMRALRDMNKPKFIFEDVPLFEGLITDLFPGLTCDRVGYEVLKVEIENFMELQRYKHTDEDKYFKQVDKVMQLYEVMLTRHTTMIVGPTGGGKSVVIQTLQAALGAVENCKVVINTLNSKSITVDELYGVLEPATREWTDGLLSKVFRTMNQPLAEGKKEIRWILYDSDVDALWVENMNSVMDDNRLLTLTNGERIRLQKHCAMLYEVFDLQYASPATISRCGMVFVDAKDLGHKPYYERWARSKEDLGEGVPEVLNILYNRYVDKIIRRIIEGATDDEILAPLKQATPRTGLNLVTQLCTMIDVMLPTENTPQEPELLENLYIFCIIWSLGGALTEESRLPFEEYVKTLAERTLPPGSLYNYYYDRDTRVWPEWDTKVKARGFELPADRKFSSILVPTIDTERYSWLLGEIILLEKPVLFVGESGTAKSVTISNYLGSLDSESFLLLNINFSSRTTSYDAQLTLEDRMDKRTGKNFGPPIGKKMIVFIDDMNMPKVDTYGTQQPIAWFKFLIEKGYIYNRATLEDKHIKDTLYCAALQPPGGGRPFLDPRYMSLFTIFNVTFPTEDNLKQIYKSILEKTLIDFEESMAEAIPKITDATLQLHAQVLEKLPRTPIKFHYIFNLRDFSRVYEGLYQMTKDKFETVGQLVKLWRNEITRVYADRLLNPEDAAVVNEVLLPDVIRQHFPEQSEYALTDPLLYGDYRFTLPIEEDEHEDPRLYEDLESFDFVKDKFERLLGDYNEDDEKRKPMNLVLFNDALDHLTRIHRILRMPRGNALLIGVGGSGKQSLTRLAAFTAEHEMFQISLSKNYTETNFRDDLKELYLMLAERSVCFLLTDSHIKEEGFLELINNVLTIGMVPAMYEEGEKDQLTSYVEDDMKKAGIVTTKDNKWNFFINKARDNLHVVLAFSPAGDTLRIRCRNFPGLVNNNSIDWFFTWPEEALSSVATYFLAKENLPQEHKQKITDHIVGVHMSIATYSREFEEQLKRKNHVTPKNYLDYINTYVSIIKDKKKQIDSQVVRLEAGLIKLDEAADAVEVMSKELAIRKKGVDEKKEIVEGIIAGIASRTEIANEQQLMANEKQAELIVFNEKISKEEAAADIALQEAIPALEAAEAALSVLDSKAFTEVKALAQPPEAIRDVCHCVCILKPLGSDTPPDSEGWTSSKAMLTNTNLLKKLREYEKDKITASMHRKLNDYFKKSTFNYETIRGVNKATGNLFMWVEAMKLYYEVNKKIEPLRRELKSARAKLDAAKKELESIQIKLTALNEELADLNEKREVNETELNRLTEEADTMERRLTAASKLITGLGGEKVRWSADVGQLKEDKVALVGDVLLCSGFLSYTGPFNFGFRQRMLQEDWIPDVKEKEIPLSDDFAIDKLLTSDVEIAKWASEGLPGDELSIQNGILTESSSRWPLCIDPQEQAVVWIREKEQRNKLTRTSLNDPKYPKELEGAIRYGYSILFENVDEEIDPMIDPVLEKAYTVQAGQKFINFGGSAIEWDNDFKMFLTTKLANPQYSPEIMAKTMIINYTVTMQGLEDQLLNEIVSHDRADLEESRKKLVVEMSENQSTRKALEESLLYELNNVTGSILDNDELIATLEETKQKSIFITEAIETAKTTKLEIDKQRNNFQPAAMRGSILFFSMTGLSNISKMYEYSLSNYLRVFRQALKEARRDNMVITRVKNIIDKLTSSIYEYVCLGIFERHKLMFSFQMTVMIIDADDDLDKIEFDFFLKGNTALEAVQMKKPYSWFPDQGWKDLDKLIVLNKNFHSLRDDILNDEKSWKSWYDLEQPESNPIPGEYSESLTTLEKLLILKVFRPDRCYNGIADFIVEKHNKNELYVTSTPATYESIYARTNNKSPVVFILSPGADPLSDVQKLADKMGFVGNKFKFLALGQGMAGQAEDYLRTGSQRGHWVMLQNCHLLPRWLKTLEKELEQMTKPHQDFRLWLTTEPSDAFPLSILQQSLKVVTEPPDGLRQNMRASYSKLTEESLEDCPAQEFRSLVYVLAFFHAVIQERRKFGKIGWNIRYEFNESDFRISFKLLTMYLTKAYDNQDEVLPWGSLRYLIGEAMYGGRVTDDFDRRVLNCYLDEYMGDFLFDTNQPFFFSTSGGFDYVIPEHGPIENYLNTMSEIPRKNSPEVFGLHANAEIGYFTSSTKDIWVNCILMQTNEGGGEGGINREDYLNGLIDDLEQKIPEEYDEFNIRKQFGEQLKPTQVVLLQELERFNKLLRVQMQTLRDLRSALKGEIGMSQDLDDLSNSCFNGFLPDLWRRLTPQTEKPLGAWMDWFTRRHKQYTKWVESGELICIWLSGLHIPESYLTALVQTTCRAKKWALDKSHLYTIITKYQRAEDVPGRLEHGCYIQGLYIEGARWDFERQCLTYQEPKELVFEMPVMQVVPVELNKLKLRGTLKTPVYVTQARRNAAGLGLVFQADMPALEHSSHWILQGVALSLNIDY